MLSQNKKYPAFDDLDNMPFGKHKGEPLQDVPASYLRWLWHDGLKDYSVNRVGNACKPEATTALDEKIKLANYIWNSQDDIKL